MTEILLLAFLFLVAGVAIVPVAARLGLGSVLGYLIAGIALSPLLALLGVDVVAIQHFAEFGVVIMMFLVGLELEPRMLWAMRARLLGLGGLQVGLSAAALGIAALALGLDWPVALTVGLILALSSTAIVLQTLNERGLMKSDGGQASFTVLLAQDIAVIPMLALIPLLAFGEAGGHADDSHGASLSLVAGLAGWQTALVTLGAIALVIGGGLFLTRPILRHVASARLREVLIATALMLVIGIALLMSLVGLSPALGTFLAGVVLANSEYRHELESDIDPFRGLLLGLFFMTVGAGIDFGLLRAEGASLLALTLGVMALKAAVLLVLAWVFKVRAEQGWLFALGLAQAGEFAFVLIAFALGLHILPADLAPRLTLIVTLSMMLTPAVFIAYERWVAPRYRTAQVPSDMSSPEPARVIIAGVGRFGGVVNRMMLASGFETVVLDHSAAQLDAMRAFGIRAFYGDATRPDLLHAAGIDKAALLIVCIDDRHGATAIVQHVVQNHPHVHVTARAIDRTHVYELWAAGCRDIIRETFDSAIRTARSGQIALGVAPEMAEENARAFIAEDRAGMVALADLYDPNTPGHLNEAYRTRAREIMQEQEERLRARGRGQQGGA